MDDKGLLDPFRKTIVDIAVKQIVKTLVARASFFALGPVNWALVFILEKVIAIMLDKTILGVNLYLIQVQTDANVKELRSLIDEVQNVDPKDQKKKDELEEKIVESASSLIRLNDRKRM